jgi:mRNA interferase MazF
MGRGIYGRGQAGEEGLMFDYVLVKRRNTMEIKQYQIVRVNLDPLAENASNKTEPCVVVSPDEMNRHLNTVMIAPVLTTPQKYPTRIRIKKANIQGRVALDQIMNINQKRITEVVDDCSRPSIRKIKSIIREMLVD